MATSLSEIYDYFMQTVTDYRLIDLFNTSPTDFETFLQVWLEFSILEFEDICDEDLNFDDGTKLFPGTLSRKNKSVLAMLMTKYWLKKSINDITQFNLHVTDRDFKVASEAANLREKVAYYNVVREDCSQMLIDYAYKDADFTNWYNQEFTLGV